MKENFDDLVYTKNEFGETWKKVNDEKLIDCVEACFRGSKENKFCVDSLSEVIGNDNKGTNAYIIEASAGKNGPGDWIEYLADMISIMNKLKKNFNDVYLLDWKNDCPDDVSYIRIVAKN